MQEQNEIEGLYRKYYADVYRYLLSMCRNTIRRKTSARTHF